MLKSCKRQQINLGGPELFFFLNYAQILSKHSLIKYLDIARHFQFGYVSTNHK